MELAAPLSATKESVDISSGKVGFALMIIWLMMVLILWGFAFLPVPDVSPDWVMRTQSVCFGTLPNGLPAPHGWMLLILSPLALLSVMWASHAGEIYAIPQFVKQSVLAKMILIILIPFTMLEAHWVGKRLTAAYRIKNIAVGSVVQNPLPYDYPKMNKLAPEFKLINQQGLEISQEVFRGKITILTFAFGHCSTICPIIIKDALTAQKKIDSPMVQTVVVSIDPWRDTPNTLASIARTWSLTSNAHILSGNPEVVLRMLENYQIKTARNEKDGNINHAAQAMVVDSQGRIQYSFLNPSVDWLTTAVGRILNN